MPKNIKISGLYKDEKQVIKISCRELEIKTVQVVSISARTFFYPLNLPELDLVLTVTQLIFLALHPNDNNLNYATFLPKFRTFDKEVQNFQSKNAKSTIRSLS